MWRQVQGISLFYIKPLLNRFIVHSRSKWIIYAGILSVLLSIYASVFFGGILQNADWKARLMLIVTECIFVGLLRGMNTLPHQMYGDRLLTLFHVSGISPMRIIIGQSASSLPLYTWSSIMVAIPLTVGYSVGERIGYGLIFLCISLTMIWITDLVCRFLFVITMRYIPTVAKSFSGISSVAYILLVSLLVWVLVEVETVTSETWMHLTDGMLVFLAMFVVLLFVLMLNIRRVGCHYYESWLRYVESQQQDGHKEEEGFSGIIKTAFDAIVYKDLITLIRNPLTKIRISLWFIGITGGSLALRLGWLHSVVNTDNEADYVLAFVTLLSGILFGEVVSALYQIEEQNYILYYAAAIKGQTIYRAKLLTAVLLLVASTVIGYLLASVILQLPASEWIVGVALAFSFSVGSTVVQLTIAAMGKKGSQDRSLKEGSDEEKMLEQSPRKLASMVSSITGLLYLAICSWMVVLGIQATVFIWILAASLLLAAPGIRYSER
ncbi:hypothetical protein [Paenibacillus terrae]|uniref:hypothetical protein n=1 Tax=Paenibacillus terrae TaxID=159743 RepID=UPI0011EB1C2F|nr:hypothetical protein [Paenibacillus terrae]